jgi:WD40 repeat protein
VHFIDSNHLLSVSDDRTVRYWNVNYSDNSYNVAVFMGHTARAWDAKIFEETLVSVSEDCTTRVYDMKNNKFVRELGGHQGKNIRAVALNKDFIFTGGEDNLLIKWKIFVESEQLSNVNMLAEYSLSKEDDQFKAALSKQKNFNPSAKVVKFIPHSKELLIGTNHGVVLKYSLYSVGEALIIFKNKELRVINSIEYIKELNIILVGLSDGVIALLSGNTTKFIQIFKNIRIPYISYKIKDSNLFIFIADPLGLTKVYYFRDINNFNLTSETDCLTLNTGGKSHLPISCIEMIQLNIKTEYILFLGDCNGYLNYCTIKIIGNRCYIYSDLYGMDIHNGNKIGEIYYNDEHKFLYTCGRDGNFKKFTINKEENKFITKYAINEVDCKYKTDLTSLESFKFRDNNITLLIGHYGRELILYDLTKNFIFHKNDIKGINRPFDIFFDNNKIFYCYTQSENIYIMNVDYNPYEHNTNVTTYTQPINGRLIHSAVLINITTDLNIVLTASEDTKIYIYKLDENLNIQYLDQITKHSGAIRQLEIIEKKNFNNRSEIIFSSVGAYSECYLFKLTIYFNNLNQFQKLELFNLCDLSIKCDKLDTRNMSVSSINVVNQKYFIIYTNTLGNSELYLFDFDKSEYKPAFHSTSKLSRSNFIALTLEIIYRNNKFLVLYGLTNGNIYLQEFEIGLNFDLITEIEVKMCLYKLHEAGVNVLTYSREYDLIVTCGEDNSVILAKIDENNKLSLVKQFYNFHSSPIKSISIWDSYIITGGYDQKVNVLQLDSTVNDVRLLCVINTCVAEINNISFLNSNGKFYVAAVGQGIEILKLE